MSSLSDCPPEIIEVVIDFLQDDLSALKACSQTCVALLSLCRKHIFYSLLISHRLNLSHSLDYLHRSHSSRITLVRPKNWPFLDANPTISEYVHKIAYHMSKLDLEDGDVPSRVLDQLHNHNVHSFHLIGFSPGPRWALVPPRLKGALLRVVQSPWITCLALSQISDFPAIALRACVNLTELAISNVNFHLSTVDEQGTSTLTPSFDVRIPQLLTFSCQVYSDESAMSLLNGKHPNDGPVLDFSNVRMLSLEVDEDLDLAVQRAFLNVTNKLETLQYKVFDFAFTGAPFAGITASINNSSISTLKRLHFSFASRDFKDSLSGLCEELNLLSQYSNVIEEISIAARIELDAEDDIGSQQWGMLDTALSKENGFPMLRQVSIDIRLTLDGEGASIYERELDEIPTRYLPWLSSMKTVLLCFSSKAHMESYSYFIST